VVVVFLDGTIYFLLVFFFLSQLVGFLVYFLTVVVFARPGLVHCKVLYMELGKPVDGTRWEKLVCLFMEGVIVYIGYWEIRTLFLPPVFTQIPYTYVLKLNAGFPAKEGLAGHRSEYEYALVVFLHHQPPVVFLIAPTLGGVTRKAVHPKIAPVGCRKSVPLFKYSNK